MKTTYAVLSDYKFFKNLTKANKVTINNQMNLYLKLTYQETIKYFTSTSTLPLSMAQTGQ